MNTDIATAAAWRPDDLAVQLGKAADLRAREDRVLAEFAERLEELRAKYGHETYPKPVGKPKAVVTRARMRHRLRARHMYIAQCRVVAELSRIQAGVERVNL